MKTLLSLLFTGYLFIFGAPAAITVNITSPSTGQRVGDLLEVRASVSSTFEVASVVAEVSGRQTNLMTVSPNVFRGMISLAGVARGQRSVLVTATDVFGSTGTGQVNFFLDRGPSIAVVQPEPGLVVSRFLPI